MKISVKVKPNAKLEKVEKTGPDSFLVWVKARPAEGKANRAAQVLLAGYFGIPQSAVSLIKGKTCKQKIFEVLA